MKTFLWIYFAIQVILLVGMLIAARIKDRRYSSDEVITIPDGFERTPEISFDPRTGQKLTVFYNSSNGERLYRSD